MNSNPFKYIILFVFVLFANSVLYAQTINPPILKEVSVIQGTGDVKLSWDFDGTSEIKIYVDDPNDPSGSSTSWLTIGTVASGIKEFTHIGANADQNARQYRLGTVIITEEEFSERFPSTFLSNELDTCKNIVSLTWSNKTIKPVYGEGNVSLSFEVFRNKNSEGFVKLTGPNNLKSYTDTDIEDGAIYEYYIASIPTHYPSVKSTSNYIIVNSEITESPDYILPLSASANGKNTDITFEIAPNSRVETFKLLKSDSPSTDFDTIEVINTTDLIIIATDTDSKPDSKVSYYKLVAFNNCNEKTTESDIINNIVLEAERNGFDISLNWNKFNETDLISAEYNVYRIISNEEPELIRSLHNIYSFTDNVEDEKEENSSIQFCYYIKAKDDASTNDNYSQSNMVCIYFEPEIYLPEAFTPKSNDKNAIFKPMFSFIPNKFELKIYSRWGNIVYTTKDYEKGWDGILSNGSSAPTGTYIYYLYVKLPDNQTIEKRGNVTVINL